jgi:hypothetical protein
MCCLIKNGKRHAGSMTVSHFFLPLPVYLWATFVIGTRYFLIITFISLAVMYLFHLRWQTTKWRATQQVGSVSESHFFPMMHNCLSTCGLLSSFRHNTSYGIYSLAVTY